MFNLVGLWQRGLSAKGKHEDRKDQAPFCMEQVDEKEMNIYRDLVEDWGAVLGMCGDKRS